MRFVADVLFFTQMVLRFLQFYKRSFCPPSRNAITRSNSENAKENLTNIPHIQIATSNAVTE